MGKNVTVTQINMCVDMVRNDFAPLISRLRSENESKRTQVREELQVKYGLIQYEAEIAALNAKIKDIQEKIDYYKGNNIRVPIKDPTSRWNTHDWKSRLDIEIDRVLVERNTLLMQIQGEQEKIIRDIQLSSVSTELKAGVEKTASVLEAFMKLLPPPEVTNGTKEIEE